ncbi:beta/alpha barrel domain-containing protein [Spirosoma aerolatum]|uniref:hypothetical protein n=1 Tax=Spirosoma aerolatum TaxID=1211326 RepID=UPI0009AF1EBA|nr:hypothetical protein [Spirosoma aerolatum]
MNKRNFIDLDTLSNGEGKVVYGNRLDAISFYETTCEAWFSDFIEEISSAIGERYFPVYRIADGEMRFLFGYQINWKNKPFLSLLKYVKYELFKSPWKTSWGESYSRAEKKQLQTILEKCIKTVSEEGKLAIYWNNNGLNAFIEYNKNMEDLFNKIGVSLNRNNYIPFHFAQAIIANHSEQLLSGKNVLVISGLDTREKDALGERLYRIGVANYDFYRCSPTAALKDDYTLIKPRIQPDIVLVAAGIGAARVVADLKHLNCPVIDIGSYLNVLSGKYENAHAGFFVQPKVLENC